MHVSKWVSVLVVRRDIVLVGIKLVEGTEYKNIEHSGEMEGEIRNGCER